MEKIVLLVDELNRIRKSNLKKLEKLLNITLTFSNNSAIIKSSKNDSFAEYIAVKIIEAVGFGFNLDNALQLQDTDYVFRRIGIKARTRKASTAAGRILGKGGKAKKILEKISHCSIILKDYTVGIIGKTENVEAVSKAIFAIIRGAPSIKAIGRLEKDMAQLKESEEDIEKYIEK